MTAAAPLTLADLERALTAADPAALLVPPRVLRRVIKKHSGLTGPGLQVPHRKSYVIGRDALLALADRADLGLKPDRELPETLLLFPTPDPRKLRAAAARDDAAQILAAPLPRPRPSGRAPPPRRRRRRGSRRPRAHPPSSARPRPTRSAPSCARKTSSSIPIISGLFTRNLSPSSWSCTASPRTGCRTTSRPISDLGAVFRVLDADVDAAGLFAATRLAGAPDPAPASLQAEEGEARAEGAAIAAGGPAEPGGSAAAHAGGARPTAEKRGNVVRAALLLEQARRGRRRNRRPPHGWRRREAILERLAARLQAALGFPEAEAAVWRRGWRLLVGPAVVRASGRAKAGCCTTCSASASTRNATCTRSIWWSGSSPWAGGRWSACCRTSAR